MKKLRKQKDLNVLIDLNKQKIEKYQQLLKAEEFKYIQKTQEEKDKLRPNLRKLNRLEKQQLKYQIIIQKLNLNQAYLAKGIIKNENIFKKFINLFKNMSFNRQQSFYGYVFLIPWIIGLTFFFLVPILMTLYWSVNDVEAVAMGLNINFVGFKNYLNLFTTQMLGTKTFLEVLSSSLIEMLVNVPVIFIFSLLLAVVLNTKFKGHQIFKAIFFIPVIYNSTVISLALRGSFGLTMDSSIASYSNMAGTINNFLLNLGFGEGLITFLISSVNRIFTITTRSGIQILIFIAALQGVPKHLYEAAKIEGATAYDCFCKITVPMLARMFLPVLIYSIVDSFAYSELIRIMTIDSTGAKIPYGIASSIAVVYFLINFMVIGLIALILRRTLKYE